MLPGVVPYPPEFVARYRAEGWWPNRSLWDSFSAVFDRYPDRVALTSSAGDVTYRALGERAVRLAAGLAQLGLRKLDRVVVQLPNRPEFVILYFALQRLGAIPILALPAHRQTEIGHFVAIADARWYIGEDGDLGELVRKEAAQLERFIRRDQLASLETDAATLEPVTIDPLDPALFLLSGGTTGLPKLIPRTHEDYWYNSVAAGDVNDIRSDDALLAVLPLGHNFPLASPGLQAFLQRGARTVLSASSRAADNLALIAEHRVTHLELVPALLIRWLDDEAIEGADLSSVRIVNTGGQRLQPEVKRRAERLLPGCTVQEVFGMAEGLLNFVRLDDTDWERRETAGRPVSPGDEVRVVDEDGQAVPDGEVGELIARGPYTIRGYFRAEEHNRAAFTSDGFYRSGDLVRLSPAGNLIVEGRRKDLINRAGEKISAEEVENLILGHPAVLDAACVAMPDPVLGERMCACLVLREGHEISLAALVDHLAGKGIARFKLPERLEVFAEFPRTSVGKVSKKDLAAEVAARKS